jgi:hypothetical protein
MANGKWHMANGKWHMANGRVSEEEAIGTTNINNNTNNRKE